MEVSVELKRLPNLLKRRGVYFSGIVLAPLNFRDEEIRNPYGYLTINSVKRGSSARLVGIDRYDFLVSVDGQPLKDIEAICRYLAKKGEGKEVHLLIHDISRNFLSYQRYGLKRLQIKDLKIVGMGVKKAADKSPSSICDG